MCLFKEHAARQERRAQRFGEVSANQSVVTAETLNNLYTGQVLSSTPDLISHTGEQLLVISDPRSYYSVLQNGWP